MNAHELPPPAQMMQMIMGAWVSQAVGAAARLGVADHLATGPKTAEELGKLSGASADGVHRLMRALSGLGLFTMSGGRFDMTPLGETLRSGVPGSMRNIAIAETDEPHWLSWGKFPAAVKEGRKMSAEAIGMEVWEYYATHADLQQQFSLAMTDISGMAVGPVLAAYDFADDAKVVDVGGAHGALLSAVLEKYPQTSGVLFDQPQVIESAKNVIEQKGLARRVEAVGGDFFKQVPAGGDVYLLKHILHDWNDERCVAILKTVRAAMKPTAKLAVVEFALADNSNPSVAHFMDLNMLVMLDGRERTAEQYAALFAQAGLRLARALPTPMGMGVFEAVPA